MKARRCIMKRGSFDKYLLNTHPKHIGSNFGIYLRNQLLLKLKDPSTYRYQYIPGTAHIRKSSKKTKRWDYRNIPRMFVPAHIRSTVDETQFYIKAPHDYSRYELERLDLGLIEEDEDQPKKDILTIENEYIEEMGLTREEFDKLDKEKLARETDLFKENLAQIKSLQPFRIAIFKKYWKRFRYNKQRREYLVELLDGADQQIEKYMGDEFVSWRDEIEGARQFLEEVQVKEKAEEEIVKKKAEQARKRLTKKERILTQEVYVPEEDEDDDDDMDLEPGTYKRKKKKNIQTYKD
uniref:Uncharacterized protein n=1 Tax=Strombidium rassoulzadegani TaxID=1082188 RepID=A0A7S3CQG7_9SPIT|mmetsp:Transcript_18108/g.30918  ORF Transcript_18108/g.30918 Transcript_18108/m.30918 type:complete len:294 (+) Transcript_18108:384-1265(+)